jgi:hypothetical protein
MQASAIELQIHSAEMLFCIVLSYGSHAVAGELPCFTAGVLAGAKPIGEIQHHA